MTAAQRLELERMLTTLGGKLEAYRRFVFPSLVECLDMMVDSLKAIQPQMGDKRDLFTVFQEVQAARISLYISGDGELMWAGPQGAKDKIKERHGAFLEKAKPWIVMLYKARGRLLWLSLWRTLYG